LRGIPIQVVISDRSLNTQSVEVKIRNTGARQIVPLSQAVSSLQAEIGELFRALSDGHDEKPVTTG
jgi:threonyl-tRNA synthetase